MSSAEPAFRRGTPEGHGDRDCHVNVKRLLCGMDPNTEFRIAQFRVYQRP